MIIISIEGVLAEPGRNWALSGATLSGGRTLYNVFVASSRVVLLSSDSSPERFRSWLLKEHFKHFSEIHAIPADWPDTVGAWKLQKVKELAISPIEFFVDTDPEVVRLALIEGIPSLLPVYPTRFPGIGRQGHYTPWDELVDTIEEQNLIRASRGLSEGG